MFKFLEKAEQLFAEPMEIQSPLEIPFFGERATTPILPSGHHQLINDQEKRSAWGGMSNEETQATNR